MLYFTILKQRPVIKGKKIFGFREEFINQFKSIAPGTRLYLIKAKPSPEFDGLVSSLFGDTKMFFKHQWIEEDIALRPEWADAFYDKCYCNAP